MRIGDGNEWLRLNGAGEALTLSSVDFENFCEPRPELSGTALDDVEQAVRILVSNDWGFRLHASYGETIDRFLGIFDKLAAEGLFPNGTGGSSTTPRPSAHGRSSGSPPSAAACPSRTAPCSSPSRSSIAMGKRWPDTRPRSAPCSMPGSPSRQVQMPPARPATTRGCHCPGSSPADIGGRQFRTGPNLVDRATAFAMYTSAGAQLSGEAEV
jgi:hypothetical protein